MDEDDFNATLYGPEPFTLKYTCSNRLLMLDMLVRMEPFTSSYYKQSRKKEDSDRVWYSFQYAHGLTCTEEQANLELIPEHFYFPEVYMNKNLIHLGYHK